MGGIAKGIGGIVGGIAGNEAAQGDRGASRDDMNVANQIIQELKNAPDASRPLILEKYRQMGVVNPNVEAFIKAGPSAVQGIQTGGAGQQAQLDALKQLQQRATTGMTAQDRAALSQAQQQTGAESEAKRQQILQSFAQRGQGGMGAELAAQLQASQAGSNQLSNAANQIMSQSQQQALQAAAQSGGLGGQLEQQQFGENLQKAQAADQMNRFNIQNQMATQQANVNAQNQAQYANLANAQNVGNMNTNSYNQEQQRQRQGEQQNFNNQNYLGQLKSGTLANQANYLQKRGDQTAQGYKDMGTGIGGVVGGAADLAMFSQGGSVHDYKNGGHVQGQANVPGDSPLNDTVDAKLSPGEIVVPRSLAQTSLGDKLLSLLNAHHEIKSHLDKAEEKAKKVKNKMADGGKVDDDDSEYQKHLEEMRKKQRDTFYNKPDPIPQTDTPKDTTMQEGMRNAFNFADGGQVTQNQSTNDPVGDADKRKKISDSFKSVFNQGGMVPNANDPRYLEHLLNQYKNIKFVHGYADGTTDGPVKAEDALQTGNPEDQSILAAVNQDEEDSNQPSPDEEDTTQALPADIDAQKQADIEKEISAKDKMEAPTNEDDLQAEVKDYQKDIGDKGSTDEGPQSTASDNLKDAQDKRKRALIGAEIARSGDLAGAGIAKAQAAPSSQFEGLSKLGELPMAQYQEQLANQQFDSSSPMSQVVRDYLTQKGIAVPENASAADLFKIAPFLQKDQALQNAMYRTLLSLKTKKDEGEANRNAAEQRNKNTVDAIKYGADKRAEAITAGQGKTQDRQSQRLAGQLVQKVNNDPIAKPSMQNLASLNKSASLLATPNSPVTPQVLSDAEQDISSAMQIRGMGGSEGKIKRTELVTIGREIAQAMQKYGNNPSLDLRKTDPKLVETVTKVNKALIDDYKLTIKDRKTALAKEYESAYGDDPKIMKVINMYKNNTDSLDLPGNQQPDKIVVQDASGKQFKLPANQLDDAIKQGYTQVK